jgi:ribosomal protein S12 methylthiotransferase RimO
MSSTRRAALVTLGCARNEVDSEELAARLERDGWTLVEDPDDADAVVVNTCGFVEAAKKDSVDTVLALADADGGLAAGGGSGSRAVVAVGCLAERYGSELATALPEADAVLGFDAYPTLGAKLDAILAGETLPSHTPKDRRTLLPISPVERRGSSAAVPGHGEVLLSDLPAGIAPASGPPVLRRRLSGGPVAPIKIASGCDRRCSFCAIPSFRGSYVSRLPEEILAEAEMLAADGVRELVLVSENSTSYGKDLGDLRALEKLLPQLAAIEGIVRIRPVYLQPAEVRPSLLEALLTTPGVAPYLDLSFQHASASLLRRMRRFGDGPRFLELLAAGRALSPELGARSNVIVGFPGETDAELRELESFLESARLDVVGVFGYSDEDGTEAAGLPGQIEQGRVDGRVAAISDLVEQLTAARAEERIGTEVEVLIESVEVVDGSPHVFEGRAAHQAPEVDGSCTVTLAPSVDGQDGYRPAVGDLVRTRVTGAAGVDLETELVAVVDRVRTPLVVGATGP